MSLPRFPPDMFAFTSSVLRPVAIRRAASSGSTSIVCLSRRDRGGVSTLLSYNRKSTVRDAFLLEVYEFMKYAFERQALRTFPHSYLYHSADFYGNKEETLVKF